MIEKKMEIMNLLLEATRSRLLQWKRTEYHTYEASAGGHNFMITFKYPLLANDDGSDADIAEVHVPWLTFTFYSGTEGFDLVLDILALCIPERAEGMARFVQKTIESTKVLRGLIDKGCSDG